MKRFGVIFLVFVHIFLIFPAFSFAYNDKTTHPALTDEIVDLFNLYYPGLKFSDAEKELIKQGSTDEDEGTRPMNHFYDPVYQRGLWGNPTSKDWATDTFAQAVLDPGYTSGSALASVSTHYFDSNTDFSWDRAVYDYVWHDKARGLKALGHVLHLLEDASVPDHTRNDAHPPYADEWLEQASPYEHWAGQFTPGALDGLGTTLYRGAALPPRISSGLQGYFDSLANYSNNNFFSKDTILIAEYLNPKVVTKDLEGLSDGNIYEFGYGSVDAQKSRLVLLGLRKLGSTESHISIQDKDDLILKNYWSRLSKQSVLHGVGVVKLFFEVAKKEREAKALLARNTTIYESLASALGFGGDEPTPLISEIPESAFAMVAPPPSSTLGVSGDLTPSVFPDGGQTIPTEIVALNLQGQVLGVSTETPSAPLPQAGEPVSPSASLGWQTFTPGLPSPGFGGGGGIALSSAQLEEPPSLKSAFLGKSAFFPGGSVDGDVFSPEATSTASSTSSALPEEEPDLEAPDLSFEIKECEGSVVSGECFLLDAEKATLTWASGAEDLGRFSIDCAFRSSTSDVSGDLTSDVFPRECADFPVDFASTTATSTIYTLPGKGIFTFTAKAFDKIGNESEKKIILESRSAQGTVVINEVAWRGTTANANDEWIELYNPTGKTISLAGWTLYAEDARPYIALLGEIKAHDYFFLERKDDNAVSDVPADLIYGNDGADWALNNTGEILTLDFASTTVDKTARCQKSGTFWCSSLSASGSPTMERIDPEWSGEDSANWGTANSIRANGLDADGGKISGTPRARNSLHYFVSTSSTLGRDKILKSLYKEYIVPMHTRLIIPAGLTLAIEPGVKVMLGRESEIEVHGNLKAEGTESDQILFTSMPIEGPWENIRIMLESAGSKISNAIFEYGGRYFDNTPHERRTMLSIIGNSTPVFDSEFYRSYSSGLRLNSSDAEIAGNKFSVGTSSANIGMAAEGGAPKISDNVFSENYIALQIEDGSRAHSERNEFKNNIDYAVNSSRSAAEFSGNTGEGNGKNGIALIGDITAPGSTTTLYENALPYLIKEYPYSHMEIPEGRAVSVEKGARLEGVNDRSVIEVLGTLELKGEASGDIIFTSTGDLVAGGWHGIWVKETGLVYGGGFTLRFAGKSACPSCAGFAVDGGRVELSNGLIQNNYRAGMRFTNSSSTLRNFEFQDHQTPADTSTALISQNSALILENLIFGNNVKNTSPEGLY